MADEEIKAELEEKNLQLVQLTKDFEEFQETSRAFEAELEQEIDSQLRANKILQSENDELKDQIKQLKV
jgi:hypothetical protein